MNFIGKETLAQVFSSEISQSTSAHVTSVWFYARPSERNSYLFCEDHEPLTDNNLHEVHDLCYVYSVNSMFHLVLALDHCRLKNRKFKIENLIYLHLFQTTLPCSSFNSFTAWNVSKYGVFSGLYFPAFGLNTKR